MRRLCAPWPVTLEILWPDHHIGSERITTEQPRSDVLGASRSGMGIVMRRNLTRSIVPADIVAPTTILTILVAGALAKTGQGEWGIASIAAYLTLAALAELFGSNDRRQTDGRKIADSPASKPA